MNRITEFGFEFGAATVTRACSDKKKGWVIVLLDTPKFHHNGSIQIYVTKTGKVRIYDSTGEWKSPRKQRGKRV